MQCNDFLKSARYLCCFVVSCLIVLAATSCNKNDVTPDKVNFKGLLNTANIPGSSSGSRDHGEVTATYSPATKKLNYTIRWYGFSGGSGAVISVVFYNAPVGFNGPEVFRINDYAPGIHTVVEGDYLVPDLLYEELMAGNFYAEVDWFIPPRHTLVRANFIKQ